MTLHGFQHPAEWEPHEATWLCWPHNANDWPGKFHAVQWVFTEMIRWLATSERVRLVIPSAQHEARIRSTLAKANINCDRVDCVPMQTNRGWMRDCGPIFVTQPHPHPKRAIADFTFNAWARYPDWEADNRVPGQAAEWLNIPLLPVRTPQRTDFVLEGGSIDVNGEGTVITTEECLLDRDTQARNPELGRESIETMLCNSLGAEQVIWLGRGIVGDDTHGHVDDLCRFISPDTVVLIQTDDTTDENHAALQENAERLQNIRLANKRTLNVVKLPCPAPLYFDRVRLPASYANFYIANTVVLVPTFNDPNDRVALGILEDLFPQRTVVGIHCGDLIWGLGAIHCLTHEEPKA